MPSMLVRRQALQVGNVIVARVPIDVMDMVPRRYAAVMKLPHRPMKQLASPSKVFAVYRLFGIFVPTVAVIVEHNDLNLALINCWLERHTTSES